MKQPGIKCVLTYRYRVKDKHSAYLNAQARRVNYVWNFCNDTQKHALKWGKRWPSTYDFHNLTSGSFELLGLSAGIIQKTCEQYHRSRRQQNKATLRYRGRRNLGWIPLCGYSCKNRNEGFVCHGYEFSIWKTRQIPDDAKILDGSSLSQDSRGRWYLNLVIKTVVAQPAERPPVGIDLGLKDLATLSTGQKIAAPQFYRRTQERLATAQRAAKRRQIKAIQAKAANQRRDFLHKVSTNIVANHGLIVVGNVNSSKLVKTRMAKSVLDAGWSSFREMLAYKSDYAGAKYLEVNEAFTTQTCSDCGSISGPKGREGLGVRQWECLCGSVHDRDVNSALNIARIGLDTLTGAAL